MLIAIDDPDDPRIALYRGASDPELLRDHHAFMAEGRLVVRRLLADSYMRARSVLVTAAALESIRDVLAKTTNDLPVFIVSRGVIEAVTGFDIHRGCLALGERATPADPAALLDRDGPVLVLEQVSNPDNVGGVFRNAAALGGSAVLLSPGCGDPLYRKTIRTSMGASLVLPFAYVEDWPGGLEALRASGLHLVALTPSATAVDIDDAAVTLRRRRLALLLGNEGYGLSQTALARADAHVRIPMRPASDSLNVAAASAIALHVFRDRIP
jgi:tRNA G18 (ribose-2'-O)-methylase SpoU